ncbi:MAG: hypothetical protein IPH75_02705 [bacterium]|nr:hypothetical protein [bacterium]
MTRRLFTILLIVTTFATANMAIAQPPADNEQARDVSGTLYDIPPRDLIDMPTAGTLPRSYFDIGLRVYSGGGALGTCNIGLSNRLTLGIAYGAEGAISNDEPNWNPDIEFNLKFRIIDEMQYFPGIVVGYSSQGDGRWNKDLQRYEFKSRGFYAVASRSFYFYKWTSGWHAGINYSMEKKKDEDKTLNGFFGFDATFNYNLALLLEYDLALNDDRSTYPDGSPANFSGQGRGYLNSSIKWLFAQNLQIEVMLKDLLLNRREASTITRELRLTYIEHF